MPVGAGFIPARIGENKKMTEHKKLQPEIRFAGFTDDWEQRKLGELATFSKGCGYSKSDLRDSGYPIILYGRLYTQYETEITEVDTFIENDINAIKSYGNEVIVPASGETSEEIARASAVGKKGIVIGGDLNIIRPKQGISTVFLALSISNGDLQKNLSKKSQGKSVVHIRNDDLKEVILKYPSYEEQTQIGNFFKQLDDTIALHQRTLEKYQKLKVSYLEKMFPKENERYPELRFPNFTDAWEQRKLGTCGNIITGNTPSTKNKLNYTDNGLLWVTPTDIKSNITTKTANTLSEEGKKLARTLPKNSILVTCIASIGKNTLILEEASCNQQINALVPNNNHDPYFLLTYSFIWSEKMKLIAGAGTMDIVNKTQFSDILCAFPSLEEQTQIGNFFKQLDDTIALHQREVEKYKKIKQSYLEKMFI